MTFSEIENQLLNSLSPNEKGNVFEAMCCWFLENDEKYRNEFNGVWIWKSELNWGQDTGIDIVARRTNGELWAIQAKAIGVNHEISKREIDSFFSASNSNQYKHRLLIATTARIGRHARTTIRHQQIQVELVLRQTLEESLLDWSPWSDKTNWPARKPLPAPSNPHIELLSEQEILRRADSYHAANNDWPNVRSGQVTGNPNLTWAKINYALQKGDHGLPGGSSLALFFGQHRGARNRTSILPVAEDQILAWADAFHRNGGQWPNGRSGLIPQSGGETWANIDAALQQGLRGLPGGSSLVKLLERERDVRNRRSPPPLNEDQILVWAEEHRRQTGNWPNDKSGSIQSAPGETWAAINLALIRGRRGLKGGSSLVKLLLRRCGRPSKAYQDDLSEKELCGWIQTHHETHGKWPTRHSGRVTEAPNETWSKIDTLLCRGGRGLQGGSTLANFIMQQFGRVHHLARPNFTLEGILKWADAYHERTKVWPTIATGPIQECPNETWAKVNKALVQKLRGLPNDCPDSLAQLLDKYRQVRNLQALAKLTEGMILTWADQYERAHNGKWPTRKLGPVDGQSGESWASINTALEQGRRGLLGGSSLAKLLDRKRGKRNPSALPKLTVGQIRLWAIAHEKQTDSWPTRDSGKVQEAPEEHWSALDVALKQGHRGLPGHNSLKSLSEM